MRSDEYIKPELDLVYDSTLARALTLGWSRQRAEDFARAAVVDYFLTAK
jgi:hypothetical protein